MTSRLLVESILISLDGLFALCEVCVLDSFDLQLLCEPVLLFVLTIGKCQGRLFMFLTRLQGNFVYEIPSEYILLKSIRMLNPRSYSPWFYQAGGEEGLFTTEVGVKNSD